MSEEKANTRPLTVKELIEARRKVKAVTVPVVGIEGMTEVRVRRLSTEEAMALVKQHPDESGIAMVVETAQESDGSPVFASLKEARAADWQLQQALVNACGSVNTFDVEKAAKNSQTRPS